MTTLPLPTVTSRPTQRGLLFKPSSGSFDSIFPLDRDDGTISPLLRTVEQLWADELVSEDDAGLLLSWDAIYSMDDGVPPALGLPAQQAPASVELRTSSFAGNSDFRIHVLLTLAGRGLIADESRIGPLVRGGRSDALVSQEVWELLKVADEMPSDLAGQLLAIGQVKEAAAACKATLDNYLASQDIITSGGVRLEIKGISPDHIELRPIAANPEAEDFAEALADTKPRSSYSKKDGELRRRLVMDTSDKQAVTDIKTKRDIRGADVPRFLDNPEAYLPESIDLSQFSPRVVGLVPQRYQSQPYVRASPSMDRDWFNTDIEIELSPAGVASSPPTEAPDSTSQVPFDPPQIGDTPPTPPAIPPEKYADLCRQVLDTGDPNVLFEDSWIEIDSGEAEKFLRLWDEVDTNPDDGLTRIPRAAVGYLLDVISNVDELEFDLQRKPTQGILPELPKYEIPASLTATLHPHQEVGYRWMRYLADETMGGLLADDMGLGKTVQVIGLLAHLKDSDGLRPALIVVPSAVLFNWQAEIRRFFPSVGYIVVHQGSDRSREANELRTADIVLTTYETLRRDQLMLGRIDWSIVVCDEAQKVKNPTAQSTSAVKAMKAQCRFALTGTPVENGLSELWCIVDFAQPGKLGSRREFRDNFEKPINEAAGDARFKLAEQLQNQLSPHYLRRTKDEVVDLPQKREERSDVSIGPRQAELYADCIRKVRSGQIIPIAALTKLIQVLSHPELVEPSDRSDEELIRECPKLQKTLEIVSGIKERGEKVLIFTRYRAMQDVLQRTLAHRFNVHARIINGSITDSRRRLDLVDTFNRQPGFQVLILSPEAAGVGLNITGANHVVHYTRLWNPAKETQATDRVHRIGQTRPVTVYYPIVTSSEHPTVEDKLDELLAEKRELARSVIWPRSSLSVDRELKEFISSEAQA